jgi:hypothetical protein
VSIIYNRIIFSGYFLGLRDKEIFFLKPFENQALKDKVTILEFGKNIESHFDNLSSSKHLAGHPSYPKTAKNFVLLFRLSLFRPLHLIGAFILDLRFSKERSHQSILDKIKLRVRTLKGLLNVIAMLTQVRISTNDIFVIFNSNFPTQRVLRLFLDFKMKSEKVEIKVLNVEYGHLPGTFLYGYNCGPGEELYLFKGQSFELIDKDKFRFNDVNHYKHRVVQKAFTNKVYKKLRYEEIETGNILFIESGELGTGFFPRFNKISEMASPYYASDIEALKHIYSVLKNEPRRIYYKRHPNNPNKINLLNYDIRTFENEDLTVLIKQTDLVVTIVSRVSQLALLNDKPVLMLGNSVLKAFGCCYTVNSKNETEKTLRDALKFGLTSKMKDSFHEYLNYELNYNSYSNGELDSEFLPNETKNFYKDALPMNFNGYSKLLQ